MKKIICSLSFLLAFMMLHAQELKIYGYDLSAKSYNCYLGKVSVGEEDAESIWNPESVYGDRANVKSIWNDRGIYGSLVSNYSPFNEDAKYPPKIKDDDGTDYGFFTVDMNCRGRCEYDLLNVICMYHEKIRKHLKQWHDAVFR